MKYTILLFTAASVLSLVSCAPEKTTYKLDTKASSLQWKGSVDPEYFHTGTVDFKEGSIEMEGEKLVGGTFEIDMNTIEGNDTSLSAEKNQKLSTHLKDTDFFSVIKYPKVTVTVSGYENGKLSTTINVLGKDVKQDIPVKFEKKDNSVTISGKFDVDFSTLKIEGMQPEKGSDEHVQPIISYEMNLILNKK